MVAVVGKREVEQQTLSVRTRQDGDRGALNLTELQGLMERAISDRGRV